MVSTMFSSSLGGGGGGLVDGVFGTASVGVLSDVKTLPSGSDWLVADPVSARLICVFFSLNSLTSLASRTTAFV